MTLLQSIILGIVQGLTEFLPISSSGHLVIVPSLLKWEKPSLFFDVTMHLGTLIALVIYFRHEIRDMLNKLFKTFKKMKIDEASEMVPWLILIGTIPAVIFGLFFKDAIEYLFTKSLYVSVFLVLTGIFIWFSESYTKRLKDKERKMEELSVLDSIIIGIAQALAIIPGISRSGWSISAGLLRGLKRYEATKFSFLLSMPAVFGAFIFKLITMDTTRIEPTMY
ncbi:MAG: undecaprenyl-diphosphate phosphatase, partial [Actinomycetia bacterium]|nr:undecaprenyl-diphosphate phosphatase [Actinomycetes bacterium]